MKSFHEYVKEGTMKRISPDIQRAKSLQLEAERKLHSLKEKIGKVGIRDDNANDYVEYCYDIIMVLIRAVLYTKGYSSGGAGAHEAEVSYLLDFGFSENEVDFADKLRYFRNGILYYGKRFDKDYALRVIAYTKRVNSKIIF
ncbi:MAG: hypothetical protein ABIG95_02975 [Candidatus Woesearchaeota archaeon]